MCQIDVCTCTRLFETMPGVQPPSCSPTTLSPANHPRCTLPLALARDCHHPYYANLYRHLYVLPPTTHIAHFDLLSLLPPASSSLSLLREQSVTASTIHNVYHHLPVRIRTPSFSSLPFSFPFCFHFRPQTPDPIHLAGMAVPCRKYENTGAVSQRECDNTKNFD